MIQQRLAKKKKVNYSYGAYNKSNKNEQWIRITEGCPHNCPFCYEPQEYKVLGIPQIVRRDVKIMDMNLLAKPEALQILDDLSKVRVDGKVVYYNFVCGFDYRFMTQQICNAIKKARVKKVRIAWDWFYEDQVKLKKAIDMLRKAGYRSVDIMIFMICNWRIPFEECCNKLDMCKFWNVEVSDCYWDNQISPNIVPEHWTEQEIKTFRRKCRVHNRIVRLGVDPDVIPGNTN